MFPFKIGLIVITSCLIIFLTINLIEYKNKKKIQDRQKDLLKNEELDKSLKNFFVADRIRSIIKEHNFHSKRSYLFIVNGVLIFLFLTIMGYWYIGLILGIAVYSISFLEKYLDNLKRKEEFSKGFPTMIEYIMSYLEGGENVEHAIEFSLELVDNKIIIEEFKKVRTDTEAYGDFLYAIKLLAKRMQIREIDYFYRNLSSSINIGHSILEGLQMQSDYIYKLSNNQIRQTIGALENKMVIITALFAFLPNVVLLLTPTLLDFLHR